MKWLPLRGRSLTVAVVLIPLLILFVYVAMRSGPLAAVDVTIATVDAQSLAPEMFGVGTVESRHTYKIGSTAPGRVKELRVDVGDRVVAGQIMGELDPVDLDDRIRSQEASLNRSQAVLQDTEQRQRYAEAEATRYDELLAVRSTSEEAVAVKHQAFQIADAALAIARDDVARATADRNVLRAQRRNLLLIAPIDGLVSARDADPGSTVVAGQTVIEIINPNTLWVHVRFDQGGATGLRAGLAAQVTLRSRTDTSLAGNVQRVEPRADAVTEEMLAKVGFESALDPMPSIGELAEVTLRLPAEDAMPVIPNAAVQRRNGATGVWQLIDDDLRFTPITIGIADLNGLVQVRTGLQEGDRIVVYSSRSLKADSRTRVVDRIAGVSP